MPSDSSNFINDYAKFGGFVFYSYLHYWTHLFVCDTSGLTETLTLDFYIGQPIYLYLCRSIMTS